MSKVKLDEEEKEILNAFEAGEFKSVLTSQRKQQFAKAAEETFKKDKRIKIRISSRDLEAIQRRALEEGIPLCQAYFTSMYRGACTISRRTSRSARTYAKARVG